MSVRWEEMHSELYSKDNKTYIIGDKFLDLYYNTPNIILQFTPANDAMMHISNGQYFEMLSSIISTGSQNTIESVLPLKPQEIVDCCISVNQIAPNIFSADNYLICRVPAEEVNNNLMIEYIYHPGILGKMKTHFGGMLRKNHYELPSNAHVYQDLKYIYRPVFLNPSSLETVRIYK